MKRRVAAKLPPEAAGKTLLEYLSSRFAYHTSEEWLQKISDGEIALDSQLVSDPSTLLANNMLMEYFPGNLVEPTVRKDYRIVYEDEYLLVIDKPGNLPVHPAGPYFAHTLWALLEDDDFGKVHFVNRLDRETSGLLIAARQGKTAGVLSKSFEAMEKCYTVLVHGTFEQERNVKGYLFTDPDSPIRKKQKFVLSENEVCGKAAFAETFFSPLQNNKKFTLLQARLRTGRMHQIRATLHGLGYPVAGDKLYGLNEQFYRRFALASLSGEDRKALILDRQALHCSKLSFIHPESGKTLAFESETPEEIIKLLEE